MTSRKKTNTKTKKTPLYTDGKSSNQSEVEKIRDLENLLRPSIPNPFKTSNEGKFEEDLANMNLTDLQSLAVSAGVFPSGNKTTLKNKLKKEFHAVVIGGKGRSFQSTKPMINTEDLTEDQKKLFNLS
jgi:hypothetical protein